MKFALSRLPQTIVTCRGCLKKFAVRYDANTGRPVRVELGLCPGCAGYWQHYDRPGSGA